MANDSDLIFEKYLEESLGLGHGTPNSITVTSIGSSKAHRQPNRMADAEDAEAVFIQAGPAEYNDNEHDEYDGEIDMARSELLKAAEYATKLFNHLENKDNIEGWVASKITKASDYLSSVYHYLDYSDNFGHTE